MRPYSFLLLILIALVISACKHPAPKTVEKEKPSFKKVAGISYTEVRRTFKSGVIFNSIGLQLQPEWRITILSADSVNIYSPEKKRFFHAPLMFDHDSIFNIAWAWLKVPKITKDSLVFQVLFVEGKEISRKRSNMFMTLYADDYIKNVLHTDAETLQKPRRIDTLFVKNKTAAARTNMEEAFAATQPLVIKSKSTLVTVKKEVTVNDDTEEVNTSNDYIQPEYTVTIKKAYTDFDITISAYADEHGVLSFRKSGQAILPGEEESTLRMMKGIVNGYLKHFLDVTPGKTLGIAHNSIVILNLHGRK